MKKYTQIPFFFCLASVLCVVLGIILYELEMKLICWRISGEWSTPLPWLHDWHGGAGNESRRPQALCSGLEVVKYRLLQFLLPVFLHYAFLFVLLWPFYLSLLRLDARPFVETCPIVSYSQYLEQTAVSGTSSTKDCIHMLRHPVRDWNQSGRCEYVRIDELFVNGFVRNASEELPKHWICLVQLWQIETDWPHVCSTQHTERCAFNELHMT